MLKDPEQHAADFDIRDPDFNEPGSVYEVYRIMREREPFVYASSGYQSADSGTWWSTRYEESYQILRDWKSFSSAAVKTMEQLTTSTSVFSTDPPRQQKLRKVLNPYFTPSVMKGLEPQTRATMHELIDIFIERGSGDLAHDVAWKMPGIILFQCVLGFPVDAVDECVELTEIPNRERDPAKRAQARMALEEIVEHMVMQRMDQQRQNDVIDVLLTGQIDGEQLTIDEILGNANLLILAGLETTSNALSVAYHFLGTHPSERDRLAEDFSLIPTAVEEFVRYSGSVHGLERAVTKDTEVAGHKFCPGERIMVNYAAANRDPREFPEPDHCVLDRVSNRHLGFGAGAHRCLGSNLARLELRVGLEEVLRRMPDYQVSDESRTAFQGATNTPGYLNLPVVFTPGQRRTATKRNFE